MANLADPVIDINGLKAINLFGQLFLVVRLSSATDAEGLTWLPMTRWQFFFGDIRDFIPSGEVLPPHPASALYEPCPLAELRLSLNILNAATATVSNSTGGCR